MPDPRLPAPPELYVIGLTGNIACGKSTVVQMLQELGAYTLDADAVTHQLQAPHQPVYEQIVAQFGVGILAAPDADGNRPLDRKALAAIVFSDPVQLKRLEAIVHPAVHQAIWAWLAQVQQQVAMQPLPDAGPVAVIDAVKLIESGWKQHVQAVWVVTCTPQQQLERLIQTRAMPAAEARQRIAAQPPQAERIAHADVVIDNSQSLEQTRQQVQAAWHAIQQKAAHT